MRLDLTVSSYVAERGTDQGKVRNFEVPVRRQKIAPGIKKHNDLQGDFKNQQRRLAILQNNYGQDQELMDPKFREQFDDVRRRMNHFVLQQQMNPSPSGPSRGKPDFPTHGEITSMLNDWGL